MNKSIKIILLTLAIILAIGGVLFFIKTIVSPPEGIPFTNQYKKTINEDISRIQANKTDYYLDSVYTAITHEITFQWDNSLITNSENDELLKAFVERYIPIYVNNCNSKFQQSVWDEDVLNQIRTHIEKIQSLTTSNGTILISRALNASLQRVDRVIQNYFNAKAVAAVGGYRGLQYAKQKIDDAEQYAKMEPINNCTTLLESLNTVRSRLGQAHYRYLAQRIEQLRNYRNYNSLEDYEVSLVKNINDELEEFTKNAETCYRISNDVSPLVEKGNKYYTDATNYFNNSNEYR